MASKSSCINGALKQAPIDKASFTSLAERLIGLPTDASVIDLDDFVHLQDPPSAELGIWLESWAKLVEPIGLEQSLDLLFIASARLDNLLFCSQSKCTPQIWLPEFIRSEKDIRMLFEASTCYQDIDPLFIYKGKVVYWGRNPRFHWDGVSKINSRDLRLLTAKKREIVCESHY